MLETQQTSIFWLEQLIHSMIYNVNLIPCMHLMLLSIFFFPLFFCMLQAGTPEVICFVSAAQSGAIQLPDPTGVCRMFREERASVGNAMLGQLTTVSVAFEPAVGQQGDTSAPEKIMAALYFEMRKRIWSKWSFSFETANARLIVAHV